MNQPATGASSSPARTPLVSVIVPGKDVAACVGDALQSLVRQFDDLRDLEVIFVDDGSEDGSLGIVEAQSARFPNFESIRNDTSRGLSSARNQGMMRSRGRFISFLDADDWLAPGHLASLARDIQGMSCEFLRTDIVFVTGKERSLRRAPQARRGVALKPRDGILPFDRGTMVDHPFAPAGLFDRRLLDLGLLQFDDELPTAEDRPWIWGLHLKANSYAVVDSPGYLYRRGSPTSLSQLVNAQRLVYLRALDQIRLMVEADDDGDLFMPKVMRTVLALTAHHVDSYDLMEPDVQRMFVDGVRALLASFPPDVVLDAMEKSPPERVQRLAFIFGETNAEEVRR